MPRPKKKQGVLTIREKQVLHLILENNSTKTIAESLNIGYETAKTHRKNLYQKLEVSSLVELLNLNNQLRQML